MKIKRIGLGTLALVTTVGVPTVVAVSCGGSMPKGTKKNTIDFGGTGSGVDIAYIPKKIGNEYYLIIVTHGYRKGGVTAIKISKQEYDRRKK